MRCKPLRTIFRAALVAGLLASCQNATLRASWEDCLHPFAGKCFIHDLDWEKFNSTSNGFDHLAKSVAKKDRESELAADYETELCIAVARQFELKAQVDAVLASLKSQSNQLSLAGSKLFASFAQSRQLFFSYIENQGLNLADRTTTLDTLPPRDGSNIFVYGLSESNEPHDCVSRPDTLALSSDFFDSEICDWSSQVTSSPCFPWQVGVDPICPEVQLSNTACFGSTSFEQPSICCPLYCPVDAVGTDSNPSYVVIAIRPPTLEAEVETVIAESEAFWDESKTLGAEYETDGSEYESNGPDYETNGSDYETNGSDYETIGSDQKTSEAESDLIINEENLGPCLPRIENQSPSDFNSSALPVVDNNSRPMEPSICEDSGYEEINSRFHTLNSSPWNCRVGRRFAFGDNAPRMPEACPPITAFSKEDLQLASRFSSQFLGDLATGPTQIQALSESIPTESDSNETTFSSEAFLINRHTSTYGSLSLPMSNSHQKAVDYAMKINSQPNTELRNHISKRVASQIRTVGQFLVDFASQIENQVEQVEIARRGSSLNSN